MTVPTAPSRIRPSAPANLNLVRFLAITLDVLSCLVAFTTLFYPVFFKLQLALCIIFPLLALLLSGLSRSVMKPDQLPSLKNPSVLLSLLLPSGALFARGLLDVNLLDSSAAWPPAGLALIFFLVLVFLVLRKTDFRKFFAYVTLLVTLASAGLWSYGTVMTANVAFDRSSPEFLQVEVLAMRKESTPHKAYYLKLAPWGPRKEAAEVRVSRRVFEDRSQMGGQAIVYYSKGLFGMPYFMVH